MAKVNKEYKLYYRCPMTRSFKSVDTKYVTTRLYLKNGIPFQIVHDELLANKVGETLVYL